MASVDNSKLKQPFGPPPVCPDAMLQLEQYLLCLERLPIFNHDKSHKFWKREPQLSSLINFPLSSCITTLKPERDPKTGELLKFKEVFVTETDSENEVVKPELPNLEVPIDFEHNLMSCPPGMKCGYDFHVTDSQQFPGLPVKNNVVNLSNILQVGDSLGLPIQDKNKKEKKREPDVKQTKLAAKVATVDSEEQKEVIPVESSIPELKISETPSLEVLEKADWAEKLEVKPVLDFHKRVPKMAFTWDFELDPFQQLAIVKLEDDNNVFVAAHTSAGKTVVAEYAIALSLQRCTRAIYTSPIKALSNQKYRDFRKSFEITKKMGEVGLITGDIQLNPKAPCLIMTTEILRSMLYNKSEVVQDLEFVIFDEVHYINDPDRGHVWEEVMMLLQSHVKIVMLSATVPNAIEFANWVGKIKKKKVYLICTQNRPVPLHFYLYTNEKNTGQMFLVRKAEGLWNREEYKNASDSVLKCGPDSRRGGRGGFARGGGGGRKPGRGMDGKGRGGMDLNSASQVNAAKQEKAMWLSFIQQLKKEDKLPVVTFVLSRGRCDDTAEMLRKSLSNVSKMSDLVDRDVSNSIREFFNKSICHLKEEDRNLPQVSRMGELLCKGIGVHHSGILPILKEIVEMLFQQGKVPLLLATETFAMGVNMPAKTVVFESIRKYDGNEWRNLLPAEFIQMAGRAGRRGIDKTGIVIIMCKNNKVPGERDLINMMFNQPSKLESQFKMTYATILKNLLRTNEAINPVERMMSSSFKEFSEQSKNVVYRQKLEKVQNAYNDIMVKKERFRNNQQGMEVMEYFFEDASEYIKLRNEIQEDILNNPKVSKDLVPGRILLVALNQFSARLGLLLAVDRNRKQLTVLIMVNRDEVFDVKCNHDKELCSCHDEVFYRMFDLLKAKEKFMPDGKNYKVVKIEARNVIEITDLSESVKLNYDAILNDWKYRQHNKNHTPSEECFKALHSLMEKSSSFGVNRIVNVYKKIEPVFIEFRTKYEKFMELKNKLFIYSRNILYTDNLFAIVYCYKKLEKKIESYKRKITEFSMSQDYRCKLNILKELKYVDSSNNVELKGRGAIRMTTNEVMVTELIFRNILAEYEPAEIAALLSCLVFQAKTNVDTIERNKQLPPSLVNGITCIKEVHDELKEIESKHVKTIPDFDDSIQEFIELKFGLVQVVYEWACDKVFSEIMELTDVQEGIIVRCIQQLNEILRCLKEVAQKVGDGTLESKMDKASNAIKRDIVFAASLYLQ